MAALAQEEFDIRRGSHERKAQQIPSNRIGRCLVLATKTAQRDQIHGNFALDSALGEDASQDGKLNRYIDSGGAVIYIASSNKESPEYLPVRIAGQTQGPANLWVRDQGFADGVHFDEIGLFSFPEATPRRRSTTLIEANSVPVLSYWRLGKGTVIYNGLEDDSDFYQRPEYPIFWYQNAGEGPQRN